MPDGAHTHGGSSTVGGGVALGVVVGLVAGAVAFVGRVLLDVFSLHGLMYTIGLGNADGFVAPELTRVITLVLLVEAGVAASAILDWVEADLDTGGWRRAWFVAHLTAGRRLVRRGRWWLGGLVVLVRQLLRRPVQLAAPVPALVLEIEDTAPVDAPRENVVPLPARAAA